MRPEMSPEVKAAKRAKTYAKSTEYAGKMLAHLDEAGCFCPSVVLFGDGSGHFEIGRADQNVADKIFERYLGKVPYRSRFRTEESDAEYTIDYNTFDTYQDVCHACDRPL